jgi:GT2 family glycosyltransferase
VSGGEWPKVTIAIVAYNKRDELRETLRKVLEELTYPADALEVVVVDNASRDGTADMLAREFPSVHAIPMAENIGAPAWNRVFARAGADWYLVLDDDCYIEGDALQRAVRSAQDEGADLVSFAVRSSVDPDYFFTDREPTGMLGFWGCAWMISRRGLDRVGGYDPGIFIWGNELDLTLRLLDSGLGHLYLPEVVAVHQKGPHGADLLESGRHAVLYRHWAYVVAKLLQPRDAALVLARMTLAVLIDGVAFGPVALRTLAEMARGARKGLGVRRPVRPAVSAAARDNVFSFANPVRFVRGPYERLRGGNEAEQRRRQYFTERRRFYPRETASLRL